GDRDRLRPRPAGHPGRGRVRRRGAAAPHGPARTPPGRRRPVLVLPVRQRGVLPGGRDCLRLPVPPGGGRDDRRGARRLPGPRRGRRHPGPLTGAAAPSMDQAIHPARVKAQALMDPAQRKGPGTPLRLVISQGRRAVREAIGVYRGGGRITDEDTFAWLAISLVNLAVRDDAWARMVPEHRQAHLALWADIVRRADGPWLPAPASLLAFTAWQAGDGPLANIALARALTADPGYSMALLLRDILAAGVPPSQARLPMTPDEVAESYARAEAPASPTPRRAGKRRTAPGQRQPGRPRRPRPAPGRRPARVSARLMR